ncbi:hypothetical protein EJB05_46312, partial [Eragrostis curvula]
MGSRARVVNVTHVHPATNASDPSPLYHGEYKLSFMDLFHIARLPMQRLFFFDGPNLPPSPSMVSTLQSSLAHTLSVFLPLAGKLAFRASSGDVVIDCSPAGVASGVKFVEAEFSGSAADMRRLATDEEHDAEAFAQLVPELEAAQLPCSVLAVQVTRPSGGGAGAVAVGVAILHAVADGHAVWQFMKAWATAAREGSLAAAGLPPPTFDRSGVRHPKGDELIGMFVRLFAPAMPMLRSPSPASTLDTTQQSSRTFVLRANEIQTLKQQILQQMRALTGSKPSKPPSTYVAISCLIWTSLVRAKPVTQDEADEDIDTYFLVSADCQRRLRPPLGDGFFGNCVKACFARARDGDLRDEAGGLAHAASAIQEAISEYLDELGDDPLSDIERCMAVHRGIPRGRLARVGSSNRFMAYETDFGWGAPTRVELVSRVETDLVTLLGAREKGAVQVSVVLDRAAMEAFAACLVVPTSTSLEAGGE